MSIAAERDLAQLCREAARRAKAAAANLAVARGEQKNAWLRQSADRLRSQAASLLEATLSEPVCTASVPPRMTIDQLPPISIRELPCFLSTAAKIASIRSRETQSSLLLKNIDDEEQGL